MEFTLYNEAADAAIAVNKFLRNVACNCGKPIDQLTWDDVAANADFLGTKSRKDYLGDEKTKSERGEKHFGDAAPEMNSQRYEEASSKRDCPTDESGQDHLGAEGVGDNSSQNHCGVYSERDEGASTTTTDHIIYFGIQAQAEGYVAERTSTRRVKDPNGPKGSTDEAPFSEDLTQGGEVLPTVQRNQNDISNRNCYRTADGGKNGKPGSRKRSNNQDFRVGGDC